MLPYLSKFFLTNNIAELVGSQSRSEKIGWISILHLTVVDTSEVSKYQEFTRNRI